MVLWTCRQCKHKFDPLKQEPYWQKPDDVIVIDCPNCGEFIATQYADEWRKEIEE